MEGKRKRLPALLAILLSAGLSSCGKPPSDIPEQLPFSVISARKQVLFRLPDNPTKTSETTAATLVRDGFKVSATTGTLGDEKERWTNAPFTRKGWVFWGDKWWSPSDSTYHFYASNGDLAFHESGATLTASTDEDIVCAFLPVPSSEEPNELVFQHIFARIGTLVVHRPEPYKATVSSISITPYTSGTYHLRTQTWSQLQSGEPVQLSASNDLWCIPGIYTLTVQYTLSLGDYIESFTRSGSIVLKAGRTSNLLGKLPPGNATEIEFSIEVADWEVNAQNLSFL